jgi:hypothetical protein
MDGRPLIITIALVGFGTTRGLAQLSTSDQAAVDGYRSAIRMAESGRSSRGIETAFSALGSMREALMQVRNGQHVLDSLPDEEFQRLGRDLPGAIVNREEVVFVEPDPDYFTKLAAARGDGADRAFLFCPQGHLSGICLARLCRATDRLQRLHPVRQHDPGRDLSCLV